MGGSGDLVTYAELDARSNRLARVFRSIGLAARDHVAILVENQARFLELCWAAQRAGLYYTPVNTHLAADEAAYIVNDCGARVLLVGSALAELAAALVQKTPRVEHR